MDQNNPKILFLLFEIIALVRKTWRRSDKNYFLKLKKLGTIYPNHLENSIFNLMTCSNYRHSFYNLKLMNPKLSNKTVINLRITYWSWPLIKKSSRITLPWKMSPNIWKIYGKQLKLTKMLIFLNRRYCSLIWNVSKSEKISMKNSNRNSEIN